MTLGASVLAEWSRFLVGGAIAAFVVAWLAYCTDVAQRARRVTSVREPVAVGAVETYGSKVRDIHTTQPDEHPTAQLAAVGYSVSVLATLLLATAVVLRALSVSRPPWGNMYEFSITASLVASIAFLMMARSRVGRAIAIWVLLAVFVTLTLAVTVLYVPPGPLVPALRSYWLVVHVGAAVLAFGLFSVSAVVSALQIVAERAEKRATVGGFGASLPSSATMDRLAYRLIAVAFPFWTVGPLILGAIWAEASWGRYWGWDPKEVWALVTWLAYAAFLHARATAGWKGAKASAVSLAAYGTVLFSYFGVNIVFTGLHTYGGL
ncbi:MAG TPA: c-type cytochrome biogenesis protein CcsB [Jiangellaceae bacterium]|nr:c-type cytochrome biogenesis protein CcsB [Jiangellaceae bacterium]